MTPRDAYDQIIALYERLTNSMTEAKYKELTDLLAEEMNARQQVSEDEAGAYSDDE